MPCCGESIELVGVVGMLCFGRGGGSFASCGCTALCRRRCFPVLLTPGLTVAAPAGCKKKDQKTSRKLSHALHAGSGGLATPKSMAIREPGTSVTTDIVESGVRAFLEVVNAIESSRRRGIDSAEAPATAV